ncbi:MULTISPECIES: hypothetical protein [unclassified Massilia]|uniref:hypothetical protein n=1 Tax=unclassified Massilia TaxID=2609279 RepID=UPI001785A66B|nr:MULTISPECIES: hypothetical protein [unclassified Massilia]MBD8529538.1 hypothetical protein [Massilia sp. CFBP 13647]MBD8673375.1 hypothetical protein [Massilia sp. CFBP 13721]
MNIKIGIVVQQPQPNAPVAQYQLEKGSAKRVVGHRNSEFDAKTIAMACASDVR